MMLTAGLGTRLRPVTERFAKPAVPFLNVPLFYFPISLMEEVGVDSIVFNTHHKPEQIESLAQKIAGNKLAVAFSNEAAAPLGSGGGIWKARELLKGSGDFLVANGDEVILPKSPGIMRRFLDEHHGHSALATILVMKHPLVGKQFGGVWTAPDGGVRGFGKQGDSFGADAVGYHYIGLLLLNERIFSYLPSGESNILYDALAAAIAKGEKVRAVEGVFTWFETGNPHDFLVATGEALTLLESGAGEDAKWLKKICIKYWPEGSSLKRAGFARILTCGSSRIDASVGIRGFVVAGESSCADSGAALENVVLLPGARVFRAHTNEILIPSV